MISMLPYKCLSNTGRNLSNTGRHKNAVPVGGGVEVRHKHGGNQRHAQRLSKGGGGGGGGEG